MLIAKCVRPKPALYSQRPHYGDIFDLDIDLFSALNVLNILVEREFPWDRLYSKVAGHW